MSGLVKLVLVVVVVGLVGAAAFILLSDAEGPGIADADLVGAPTERVVGGSTAMTVDDVGGEEARLAVPTGEQAVADAGGDAGSVDGTAKIELPTAEIRGRVVDEAGRAVSGAAVAFLTPTDIRNHTSRAMRGSREALEYVEAVTDINGEFTLDGGVEDDVTSGPQWLRSVATLVVRHDDFATKTSECAGLAEGEYNAGTIVLGAGARLVGRVVDGTGRSLEGARVTSGLGGDGRASFMVARRSSLLDSFMSVETGEDGRFELTGLELGEVWVLATRDGHLAETAETETQAGMLADVGTLTLQPGAAIAGHVRTPSGEPVAGARVTAFSMAAIRMTGPPSVAEMRKRSHQFGLSAETDSSGFFELAGLEPGSFTVRADAPGFAPGEANNVAVGTRDTAIELALLGSVLVTLRSQQDNELIDGAEIRAEPATFRSFRRRGEEDVGPVVYTGDGIGRHAPEPVDEVLGRYLITGAGESGLDLSVRVPGYALLETEVPGPSDGGMTTAEVFLVPEIIVRGRVVDLAGEPVDDATVALQVAEEDDFELSSGGNERTIRRSVRRRINIGGDEEDEINAELITARTDSNGMYEIRGATEGHWDISADADGFAQCESMPLELQTGQALDGVDMALEQGGTVFGLVSDADGEPVASAQVLVSRVAMAEAEPQDEGEALASRMRSMFGGNDDGSQRTVTADAVGRYRAADLPAGEYEVSLAKGPGGLNMGGAMVFLGDGGGSSSDNDVKVRTRIDAGAEVQVDLVKPRSAVIEGRVIAAGVPVPDVKVSLSSVSDDSSPFGNMRGLNRMMGGGRSATTDRFGYYVFEDVEVGAEGAKYEVVARVQGAGFEESAEVEVTAGGTSQADLVFSGSTLRGRIVDAESGDGVAGLVVTLASTEEEESSVSAMVSFAFSGSGGGSMNITGEEDVVRTDADGVFEVKFLDAGSYMASTGPSAYIRAEEGPFEVKEDETTDDVRIEVTLGGAVEGVIRNQSAGEPMAGMLVQLMGGDSGRPALVQTEPDGSYRFEGLEAGGYEVRVMGTNFGGDPIGSADVTVVAGETAVADISADDSQTSGPGGGTFRTITIGR